MAKTVANINIELTMYQAALADLAIKYITKELHGHQNINCSLSKLTYGVMLLEALRSPARTLELEQLTQTELEDELEKLNDICGCVAGMDPNDLILDTINATLTELIPTT